MSDSSVPAVDIEDLNGERVDTVVHGVLLAAGTSSRYGDANKLLATIGGDPLVHHAARTFVRSDIDSVTVILGHEAERVQTALADSEISFSVNNEYDRGQSTSVRKSVNVAQERNADAILIALGDMPNVSIDTINGIIEAYERGAGNAIAAAYDGQRGNPVLFDAQYFGLLADISGDIGGRQILLSSGEAILLETDDPGVLRDVDRPADL